MKRLSYFVPIIGGIESATVGSYLDLADVAYIGQKGMVEDVGEFFSKPVIATSHESWAPLLNTAVMECPTDYAVLIFPQNFVFDRVLTKPSQFEETPHKDLFWVCEEIAALMDAFGAECGGVGLREHTRLWGLTPFSTVKAPSPNLVVINKEKFCGFKEFEFPFITYDYFLRSLWNVGVVIRYNGIATSYPDMSDDAAAEAFIRTAETGDVIHKFVGKNKQPFLEFNTALSGL